MARIKKTMDGNTCRPCRIRIYQVAAIYPITPSSVMAEVTDVWSAQAERTYSGKRLELSRCSLRPVPPVRFTDLWQPVL